MRLTATARREKILVGARELFACHGFHATGMAHISERSGVAVGQIYRDFVNKEAIVASVVEAGIGNLFTEISSFGSWAANFDDETCERVSEMLLRIVSDDSRQLILEFFAEASRNPVIASYLHGVDERARSTLIHAFAADAPTHVNYAQLGNVADLLLACLGGIASRTIANPKLDLGQLISVMSHMITRQLYHLTETPDR